MKTPSETSPVSRSTKIQVGTSEALLDAAERLFAHKGVEGVSVREIVRAAGANLAAVNYHFGSKDRLAVEVFARRLRPVNRHRIARLDALEAEAGRGKLKLGQIIEALIRPALEVENDATMNCMQLISRCFQEPNPELKEFVEQQFAEVAARFDAAILRAAPGLPPGELFWRMNFVFGALHHGQERWLRFEHLPRPSGIIPVKPDREGFIQRAISFVTAGLAAPMPGSSETVKTRSPRPLPVRDPKTTL